VSLRDDPDFQRLVEQVDALAQQEEGDPFLVLQEISYVFQERLLTDEERGRLSDGRQSSE
jgi:hypothetical protein